MMPTNIKGLVINTKPYWIHDYTKCTFLGCYGLYDLYHCLQSGIGPTVITRWGNNGEDYKSSMFFTNPERDNDLFIAKLRCLELKMQV